MNKMLLVGFICLSLGAFAQQSQNSQEQRSAPRDAASGMASGKRMHKPLTMHDQASGQATGKPIGNKSAADDWSTSTARNNSNASSSGSSTSSSSGSGSATSAFPTGKRQHQPFNVSKRTDVSSTKLVTKQPDGKSPKTIVVHKEIDASTPR
jgi:hypothetical protein